MNDKGLLSCMATVMCPLENAHQHMIIYLKARQHLNRCIHNPLKLMSEDQKMLYFCITGLYLLDIVVHQDSRLVRISCGTSWAELKVININKILQVIDKIHCYYYIITCFNTVAYSKGLFTCKIRFYTC